MKIKLTKARRNLLADKLMDTANYAMAGLVFAVIAKEKFDVPMFLLGLLLYLILMFLGFIIR